MDINNLSKYIALKDYNEKFKENFKNFLWVWNYNNFLRSKRTTVDWIDLKNVLKKIDLFYVINDFIKNNEHKNLILKIFLDNYMFFGILNIKEISKRSFIFFNIDEDKFQFFNVNEANAILGKFYFKIKESEL